MSDIERVPEGLADRIERYLNDAPMDGGHSDKAGGTAWELLEEAMHELRDAVRTKAIEEAIMVLGDYMTDQMDDDTGTFDDFPEIDAVRSQLIAARDGTWEPLS